MLKKAIHLHYVVYTIIIKDIIVYMFTEQGSYIDHIESI